MNKNLTIIISGKKQSGKSSLAKYILTWYLNQKHSVVNKWTLDSKDQVCENGEIYLDIDNSNSEASKSLARLYSVQIFGFADPLKKFCIDTLGLSYRQCYGSDQDKNSPTHIVWETIPAEVRADFCKKAKKLPTGNMTVREVLQVFGTNICRKMDPACWARSTYSVIGERKNQLSIICDARFPNEITMGTENGAKAIRLQRKLFDDTIESEVALDGFPSGEYDLVVDNQNMTRQEKEKYVSQYLLNWMK